MTDLIQIDSGDLWTTSNIVADEFGREHRNVMRSIRRLIRNGTIDTLSTERISYLDSMNRSREALRLNERAFLIAMPFIGGEKAEQGQKRLVDEFLKMRRELQRLAVQRQDAYWQQKRVEGKAQRLALTNVIQEFVSYAKRQGSQNAEKYFMSITKMEYAALELVKMASDKSFRDTLDAVQHSQLTVVEMACQEALRQGMEEGLQYKDCYQKAKAACLDLAASLRKHLPRSQRTPIRMAAQRENARVVAATRARNSVTL